MITTGQIAVSYRKPRSGGSSDEGPGIGECTVTHSLGKIVEK